MKPTQNSFSLILNRTFSDMSRSTNHSIKYEQSQILMKKKFITKIAKKKNIFVSL
jgi:hypothetical protein